MDKEIHIEEFFDDASEIDSEELRDEIQEEVRRPPRARKSFMPSLSTPRGNAFSLKRFMTIKQTRLPHIMSPPRNVSNNEKACQIVDDLTKLKKSVRKEKKLIKKLKKSKQKLFKVNLNA